MDKGTIFFSLKSGVVGLNIFQNIEHRGHLKPCTTIGVPSDVFCILLLVYVNGACSELHRPRVSLAIPQIQDVESSPF